jgi:hypothetical protein
MGGGYRMIAERQVGNIVNQCKQRHLDSCELPQNLFGPFP